MPIIGPVVGVLGRAAAALGGRAALGRAATFAKSPAGKAGAVGFLAGNASGRGAAFNQGKNDPWFPSSL